MDILKVKINNEWVPIPAITGPIGATGATGATGAPGAQGLPGQDGKNGFSFSMGVTALASGWSDNETPYQVLSTPGVTTDDTNVFISLSSNATIAQRNAAALARIVCSSQMADSLLLVVNGVKPSIDIPLTVVVSEEEPGYANGVSF